MQKVVKKDFKTLCGQITVPADKSISHRAIMLSSLAKGKSVIKNFSDGQDPLSTLEIFKKLGVEITREDKRIPLGNMGMRMGVQVAGRNIAAAHHMAAPESAS